MGKKFYFNENQSWGPVLERCIGDEEGKSVVERVKWILDRCGQGEKWMKSLEGEGKRESKGEEKAKSEAKKNKNQ